MTVDIENPKTFAHKFKSLRLQAEISTLREMHTLLFDLNYFIEESTLSRWQNGTRIPRNRNLLLAMIKIFISHKANLTLGEINDLFHSAHMAALSKTEEREILPQLFSNKKPIFLLPPQSPLFDIADIHKTVLETLSSNDGHLKITFHGLPGTGKSSIAIALAHQIKPFFNKGVIWIRVYDISIQELEKRLSEIILAHIRTESDQNPLSHIESRELLVIFDNVENEETLNAIPDIFFSSSYMITTTRLPLMPTHHTAEIQPLKRQTVHKIFAHSSRRPLTDEEIKIIDEMAYQLGYLALPIVIIANILNNQLSGISLRHALQALKTEEAGLAFFQDHFMHIISAFEVIFNQLTSMEKTILKVIADRQLLIFDPSDLKNQMLSESDIQWGLITLSNKSLIDQTSASTYRIQPILYRLLRSKVIGNHKEGHWIN